MSKIEWTGKTWNPVTGCMKVSPGCKHCYAERMAARLHLMQPAKYAHGFWPTYHPGALLEPLHRGKPTTWFVCSMSDLFQVDVPDEFISRVFAVMALSWRHTYQVLTKRAERAADWLAANELRVREEWGALESVISYARNHNQPIDGQPAPRLPPSARDWPGWPPPNVWLGASCEDRAYGLPRLERLRNTPAAVRFVSAEPLLEGLGTVDLTGIDWLICGGESGPGARPMAPDWARSLRDQCQAQKVAFFFKQWGGTNKKKAGRTLDGRTWDEMPAAARGQR
jgi:protein gp37